MKVNKPGHSPQPDNHRKAEHPQEPVYRGRRVKASTSQRLLIWCSSLIERMVNKIALIQRSIKTIFVKSPYLLMGRFWEQVTLPESVSGLKEIAIHSALAQIPYTLSEDPTNTWQLIKDAENFEVDTKKEGLADHYIEPRIFDILFGNVDQNNNQTSSSDESLFKNIKLLPNGMIIDKKSGLVAALAINPQSNNVILIFGGTNSGVAINDLLDDQGNTIQKNEGLYRAQVAANLHNLIGTKVPKCYHQASEITKKVNALVHDHDVMTTIGINPSTVNLVIVGHSLGGAMVQYSSAKNEVSGYGFSSAALGKKTLKSLTVEQKRTANRLVANYLIDRDPLTTPIGYRVWHKWFAPTILGRRSIIKGVPETGQNTATGRHSWSHKHYMAALKKLRDELINT